MLRRLARLLLATALVTSWIACAASEERGAPPPAAPPAAPTGTPAEAALIAELTRACAQEVAAKGLGSLSIALVDGDRVVWSAGFGEERPGVPADGDTVYRVGSVSKLFTDLALMQLVERGKADLDAPVAALLPDFAPRNPFGGTITLRQLTAHRAGLVREPPAGHYFDDSGVTLAQTVDSLNDTALVCAPGTRTKYSNAGIAVIGRALERHYGAPYAELMHARVLAPLGLDGAAFTATPAIRARLATARMWTYDGRSAPAPLFELGMAPAGSLYASMHELARFLRVLFADGRGPDGALLRPETLASMWTPALGADGRPTRYGIGFAVDELDGRRRCGHGGAIYGYATTLSFLPDERLGVAVAAALDVANAVTDRLAEHALRGLLAARAGQAPARWPESAPVPAERARALAGRWRGAGGETVEIVHHEPRLTVERRGMIGELRLVGGALMVDDRHLFGTAVGELADGALEIGGERYERAVAEQPAPCPQPWRELIGEYGWDHNVLFVRERDGRLEALIEWFWFDALSEVAPDVFALPAHRGLYPLERLEFRRDAGGRVTHAVLGAVAFARRPAAAAGETFRIAPLLPVAELRLRAAEADPPQEAGLRRAPDLVDLQEAVPGLVFDVRYATTNNFLGAALYPEPRAFLQRPAAAALARVQAELAAEGYDLLIHDAYRPWHVTQMFWDATPVEFRHFVADPREGSRHNRGCAVDLTLVERASGRPVEMPGGYDEFSARSAPEYPGGTSLQRWRRDLLRTAMERQGFRVYEWEWWHFDFAGWEEWPILDASFAELDAAAR
jgi:CubicO group peptidase (beta-lactamase class C family)/D-alanyl-D-alanine dipeptidase